MRVSWMGAVAMLSLALAAAPVRAADEPAAFRLTLKDHKFNPPRLTVPAGKRVIVMVKNADDTPAEFESSKLGVEKIISAGREAIVRIGPLAPGEYPFLDDFHQEATGILIAAGE